MRILVQKYGGSILHDKSDLCVAAKRIKNLYEEGFFLVIVVSARYGLTDTLLDEAFSGSKHPSEKELATYLSIGEQESASLLAFELESLKVPCASLNAHQLGIQTREGYLNADIELVHPENIVNVLKRQEVVIATGFQGLNAEGELTLLGRGGSDLTAIALSSALKAERCQLFKDVCGIFTEDPNISSEAERIPYMSHDDLCKLIARNDSTVIQKKAAEYARRHVVPFEVKSFSSKHAGTLVLS